MKGEGWWAGGGGRGREGACLLTSAVPIPDMNGIEIPDPYYESELRQQLGIATDMCYTILESPEHASN